MGSISLRLRTESPIQPTIGPNDFVTEHVGDVVYTTQDEKRFRIGTFMASRVNVGDAWNDGEAFDQIADAHSTWLCEIFDAVYDGDADDFNESIRQMFEPSECDLLIVESIVLHPRFRGRRLGLLVARHLIDLLGGGCGLTVATMVPVQPGDAETVRAPRKWLPGRSDASTHRDACKKLRNHFGPMGFRNIGETTLHGLSMSLKMPRMSDLLKTIKCEW